jgi:3-deoxy-7-phosphoheptulonate synthase
MIIITQPNTTEEQINRIVTRVREFGLDAQISRGASRVIIGVIGPEVLLREKPLAAMAGVEAIVPVLKPYKLAARDSRGASSVANRKMLFSFPVHARWKVESRFCRSQRS